MVSLTNAGDIPASLGDVINFASTFKGGVDQDCRGSRAGFVVLVVERASTDA